MMKTGYLCKLVLVVLLSFLHQMLVSAMDDNAIVDVMFDVIPNAGTMTFKKETEGLYCEFTYSCMGGTKEEWDFAISKYDNEHYVCYVERHIEDQQMKESYLYFESFELKIGGGKLEEGFIIGSKGDGIQATEKEHILNHNKNTVSHSPGNFKNTLHKVYAIFSKKGRSEL